VARCVNLDCPAQSLGRIVHFASRGAMDISHLGERTAGELLERDLVRDVGDLFFLEEEDVAKLPNFKDKSITNLLQAIASAKERPMDRLLYGLGIHHVGATAARLLADAFGSIERIRTADEDEIAETPGVGSVIAQAVREYFDRPATQKLLEKLKRAGV